MPQSFREKDIFTYQKDFKDRLICYNDTERMYSRFMLGKRKSNSEYLYTLMMYKSLCTSNCSIGDLVQNKIDGKNYFYYDPCACGDSGAGTGVEVPIPELPKDERVVYDPIIKKLEKDTDTLQDDKLKGKTILLVAIPPVIKYPYNNELGYNFDSETGTIKFGYPEEKGQVVIVIYADKYISGSYSGRVVYDPIYINPSSQISSYTNNLLKNKTLLLLCVTPQVLMEGVDSTGYTFDSTNGKITFNTPLLPGQGTIVLYADNIPLINTGYNTLRNPIVIKEPSPISSYISNKLIDESIIFIAKPPTPLAPGTLETEYIFNSNSGEVIFNYPLKEAIILYKDKV